MCGIAAGTVSSVIMGICLCSIHESRFKCSSAAKQLCYLRDLLYSVYIPCYVNLNGTRPMRRRSGVSWPRRVRCACIGRTYKTMRRLQCCAKKKGGSMLTIYVLPAAPRACYRRACVLYPHLVDLKRGVARDVHGRHRFFLEHKQVTEGLRCKKGPGLRERVITSDHLQLPDPQGRLVTALSFSICR